MTEKDTAIDVLPSAEMVEGPYYGSAGPLRANIREDCSGAPLDLRMQVKDAGNGRPLPGIRVDIWHSDARWYYSGYDNNPDHQPENVQFQSPINDETYLRGAQETDADGYVMFRTIYPGWYPGRTVHIHFRAFTSEGRLIASQLYFPDEVSDTVFESEPYSARGPRRTTNANDSVGRDDVALQALMGRLTSNDDGYVVSLTVGVVR